MRVRIPRGRGGGADLCANCDRTGHPPVAGSSPARLPWLARLVPWRSGSRGGGLFSSHVHPSLSPLPRAPLNGPHRRSHPHAAAPEWHPKPYVPPKRAPAHTHTDRFLTRLWCHPQLSEWDISAVAGESAAPDAHASMTAVAYTKHGTSSVLVAGQYPRPVPLPHQVGGLPRDPDGRIHTAVLPFPPHRAHAEMSDLRCSRNGTRKERVRGDVPTSGVARRRCEGSAGGARSAVKMRRKDEIKRACDAVMRRQRPMPPIRMAPLQLLCSHHAAAVQLSTCPLDPFTSSGCTNPFLASLLKLLLYHTLSFPLFVFSFSLSLLSLSLLSLSFYRFLWRCTTRRSTPVTSSSDG